MTRSVSDALVLQKISTHSTTSPAKNFCSDHTGIWKSAWGSSFTEIMQIMQAVNHLLECDTLCRSPILPVIPENVLKGETMPHMVEDVMGKDKVVAVYHEWSHSQHTGGMVQMVHQLFVIVNEILIVPASNCFCATFGVVSSLTCKNKSIFPGNGLETISLCTSQVCQHKLATS